MPHSWFRNFPKAFYNLFHITIQSVYNLNNKITKNFDSKENQSIISKSFSSENQ